MKTIMRKLFVDVKKKNVFLWTAMSGGIISASSVITLLVLTRVLGLTEAGIYSIALSVSQQLSSIGTYCLRTFHSSDINKKYSFNDYRNLRIISCIAMLIVSIIWVWVYHYDGYKASIVLTLCLYKVVQSYCDLYEGTYQRNNRFDISGKSSFTKECAAVVSSIIIICLFHNLFFAMLSMSVVYLVLFFVIDVNIIDCFEIKEKVKCNWHNICSLLVVGFPIVVNSYLMLYINNSSKYAIDQYCSEAEVAIFNVLYMPIFCINLLMGFVTRPLITVLAVKVEEKKKKDVRNILLKEIGIVAIITLVVILGMYTVGLAILGFLYSMELAPYKTELLLLLFGGAFYATYTIFYYVITILRKQFTLLVSCLFGAGVAVGLIPFLVKNYGMLGASAGYAVIMFCIMMICRFFTMIYLKKYDKTERKG